MADKRFREWNPGQPLLLPPDVRRWLPDDHLVWFVLDLVDQLDLSDIEAAIRAKDPRGTRPFDPKMMMGLLMYAYAVGVFSSRKIERATYEDVAFRVLTADQHPDHDTIAAFRRAHLERFEALFVDVLRIGGQMGLVRFGLLGLDGTKVAANASKHKAMSYDRMQQQIERLQSEIAALVAQAEAVDTAETARYGDGAMGDLPAELARREQRLARIREAKAAMEAEAVAARAARLREQGDGLEQTAADPSQPICARRRSATLAAKRHEAADRLDGGRDDDEGDGGDGGGAGIDALPEHHVAHDTDGVPTDKAQRNFTDADSRIMKARGQYLQGYNAQAMVDSCAQLIVACGVGNQGPDNDYFAPMVQRTVDNAAAIGVSFPRDGKVTADAGYWSPDNVTAAVEAGLDPHIAVQRIRHGLAPPDTSCEPPGDDARAQMAAKLRGEEGRKVYARRKVLPEPVFGQIKAARGFRQFLLRGLGPVRGEWALVCTMHNALKMWRSTVALPAG